MFKIREFSGLEEYSSANFTICLYLAGYSLLILLTIALVNGGGVLPTFCDWSELELLTPPPAAALVKFGLIPAFKHCCCIDNSSNSLLTKVQPGY